VTNKTYTSTAALLTPIWERILQRSKIGEDENFFDLGGDSLVAVQLFTEIAQVCGREFSPVTIYCAPTIASLAALLEEPTAPRLPAVMQLKEGSEEPPLFLAHGLGGTAIDFYQFAKHLQTRRSIYGLQAKGTDGVDEPFGRIEDLALFYLAAVRELQPHGPYYFVGYSLGGLVTLEMAQHLLKDGEKVALLAMLESYPHPRFLSVWQRLRLVGRLTTHRASKVGRLPVREALSYIFRPSERRLYVSRDGSGNAPSQLPSTVSYSPVMQRTRESAYRSLTQYKPRFYRGPIKFVKAETLTDFPDDPAAIWSKLAMGVEVETVPGDHLGILGAHYETLASVVSRFLREAST
jgi:acetoacetyl-CoA synthetase